MCSGSNDHTTRLFWCRNRPVDPPRDKFNTGYNQGFGDHNPAMAGRVPSNFPVLDGPSTPGPFATALPRNEGTIPGIGVAMPLSIDTSDQGEQQQQSFPVSMPGGAPPLPPGPHPSLLAPAQSYQQFSHHMPPQQQQQHQPYQQQMPSLQVPPSNISQMQPPPSHLSLLPHSHLSRPPPMAGSLPMPSLSNSPQLPPTPGQLDLYQLMLYSNLHAGGYANGIPNLQGPSGLNPYQAGNQSGTGMRQVGPHMGLSHGMPPPPPPQHGSIPQ
ncbi:hypothetical protein C5167_007856 [Papaver somniferum]|nr:hypothetical protein C5167_007856 [Papaver somniferum]